MTTAEKHFTKLANNAGLKLSDAEIFAGIDCFVNFLRAAKSLENNVKNELRNSGPDQFRQTRQGIISAGTAITPTRICRAPANDRHSRICSC